MADKKTSKKENWNGVITFTKKDDKDLFAIMRWLASAVSKDGTRYFMNGVYSERNARGSLTLTATDGRRYHRIMIGADFAEKYGFPAGVIMKTESTAQSVIFKGAIEGDFPNCDRVTPAYNGVKPFSVCLTHREYGLTPGLFDLYSRGVKINLAYMKDLSGIGESWNCYLTGFNKAVVFRSAWAGRGYGVSATAVIMPIYATGKEEESRVMAVYSLAAPAEAAKPEPDTETEAETTEAPVAAATEKAAPETVKESEPAAEPKRKPAEKTDNRPYYAIRAAKFVRQHYG
jgi:hypothetical protein